MHIYDYSRKITTRSNKGPYGRTKPCICRLNQMGLLIDLLYHVKNVRMK